LNEQSEKFSYNVPGKGIILKLCFAVMFFYQMSEDRKRQAAILDILDEHCAMTGNRYQWTRNPRTSKWKSLPHGMDSYIHPREWVLTNPYYKWTLLYHGGMRASDASDVEVYSFNHGNTPKGDMTSFLRIHLPLSVLQDVPAIVERIRSWSELLQPDHGYAGISLARSHGYERGDRDSASFEYRIGQDFPGIDVYDTVMHSLQLGKNIKGVDWLVTLSDAFLDRIGGLATVRERMGDLPVLEYKGGVVLQAGSLPQIGLGDGQDVHFADYRHVAAIIEPLRQKNYRGGIAETLIPEPKFDQERYQQWLARFSPSPE
jgi:hypothetical protein